MFKGGCVFFFGKNSHGQLGVKLHDDENKLVYDSDNCTHIPTLCRTDVQDVSAGVMHSGIIVNGPHLYTFGSGSFGKLGIGNSEDMKIPHYIPLNGSVVKVACANEHTLALTNTGRVFSWGMGSKGRLGHGHSTTIMTPTVISKFADLVVSSIHANGASSAAVTNRGSVFTWGYNKYGQCGLGNNNEEIQNPTLLTFFNNIVKIGQISVGDRHMAAVDTDGWLYSWGSNAEMQLGLEGPDKNTPTMNPKLRSGVVNVECGGPFTAAITNENDDNSLYVFGTFANIYVGSTPKKFMTGVESVACSHDCSNNLLVIKKNGEVWSAGWSRYGQAGTTDEVAQFSRLKSFIGKPDKVVCGSYHSAVLFKNPVETAFQMLWGNYFDVGYDIIRGNSDAVLQHTNFEGDNILHVIAKKRVSKEPDVYKMHTLVNKLNSEGRPPFFYHGALLTWYKSNMPDIYARDKDGQTCLHYYCKNNMLDDVPHILGYSAFDERVRDSEFKRAFEYLPKATAFQIKKRFGLTDIGIIFNPKSRALAEKIKRSIEGSLITCELISDASNVKKRCIGYVFMVCKESLETSFTKDLLINVLVKSPMISIWAEKLTIKDPTLESCIYRSQLVDLSQDSLYHDSLSVLLEGIDNLIQFIPKEDTGDDEETDLKVDTAIVKISGEESIYLCYDSKQQQQPNQYDKLFKFLESNKIKVVPKEKGLLSSWVVVAIINKEFSAQMRDEISLAENRNKPVIPIYYGEGNLDQGSIYTFANAPKLRYDDESFDQLVTLIKLNYQYLNNSSKLFNLLQQ